MEDNKIVKKFKKGCHSFKVVGLEDGSVMKVHRYPHTYKKEKRALKRLTRLGCSFTPRLRDYDDDKMIIYMTDCGDRLNHGDRGKYGKQMARLEKKLKRKYGVSHNDMKMKNMCKLDGKLYVIDFSMAGKAKKK